MSSFIICFTVCVLCGLFPLHISRNNEIFGVALALKRKNENEVIWLKRVYFIILFFIDGLNISFLLLFQKGYGQNTGMVLLCCLIPAAAVLLLYKLLRARLLLLRHNRKWEDELCKEGEQILHQKRLFQSFRPYRNSSVVILLSIWAFTVYSYAGLPARLPMQFDRSGHPLAFVDKSVLSVFAIPFVMLALWSFFAVTARRMERKNEKGEDYGKEAVKSFFSVIWVVLLVVLGISQAGLLGLMDFSDCAALNLAGVLVLVYWGYILKYHINKK